MPNTRTEHTPGPWEWRNGRLFRSYPETFASVNIFVIHDDRWMPRPDDARLIAAAPDLLAALESLLNDLSADDEEGLFEHSETVIRARTAIAKARGAA